MRKLIGLCFLTATLVATSAYAQGMFIERGDPNAIAATAGGGLVKDAYGGGVGGGWTYRGVFDAGANLTFLKFTSGNTNKLSGLAIAPFVTVHAMKAEEDEMPVSLAFTLVVLRQMYFGNTPVANPEGWATYLGASVYRRFDFGAALSFVPEVFAALQYRATRYYSGALDQASGNTRDPSGGGGYSTDAKFSPRVLLKPNLLVKAGNTKYLVMPYVGYIEGLAVGGNIGAMF